MKKLEDVLGNVLPKDTQLKNSTILQDNEDKLTDSDDDYVSEESEPIKLVDVSDEQIPERVFVDIQIAGFQDEQSQEDSFFFVTDSAIPFVGDATVLEISAKRGDLYTHLKKYHPSCNIKYTGIDSNDLLIAVGQQKYTDDANVEMVHGDFINMDMDTRYDTILSSLYFINNYGIPDSKKYEHLERFLEKALSIADYNVSLLFMHDNGGDDTYLSFPLPNTLDTILKFNFIFRVDFANIPDMYRVLINTKQKRYL